MFSRLRNTQDVFLVFRGAHPTGINKVIKRTLRFSIDDNAKNRQRMLGSTFPDERINSPLIRTFVALLKWIVKKIYYPKLGYRKFMNIQSIKTRQEKSSFY